MPVADQTQTSVALVFVLDSFRLARLHRNCVGDTFESLKPGHFVNAHRVRIRLEIQVRAAGPHRAGCRWEQLPRAVVPKIPRMSLRSFPPRLTDRQLPPVSKNSFIFLGCVQPVLASMRLSFRSSQVSAHLTGRDRRNDFPFDAFIAQFGVRPLGNRTSGGSQAIAMMSVICSAVNFPKTPLRGASLSTSSIARRSFARGSRHSMETRQSNDSCQRLRHIPTGLRANFSCTARSLFDSPANAHRITLALCTSRCDNVLNESSIAESRPAFH